MPIIALSLLTPNHFLPPSLHHGSPEQNHEKLLRCLVWFLRDLSKAERREMKPSDWTTTCHAEAPQQKNGYDCGMFVVM